MKRLLFFLIAMSFSLSVQAMSYPYTPMYFMVKGLNIESSKIVDGTAEVTMKYMRPCWAERVEVVKALDVIGSPVNPGASFFVAFGVLLKEKSPSRACFAHEPPEIEETVTYYTNVTTVEGNFLGFQVITGSELQ